MVNVVKIIHCDFWSYKKPSASALQGATHCVTSLTILRVPWQGEVPWSSALPGLLDEVWGMRKHRGFSGPIKTLNDSRFNYVWLPSHETSQARIPQPSQPTELEEMIWNCSQPNKSGLVPFLLLFVLATLHHMWDLSSLTRDETHVPCIESVES